MKNRYCPFCGAQLVEKAMFCLQCGEAIIDTKEKPNREMSAQPSEVLEKEPLLSNLETMHTIKIGKYDILVTESLISYNKVRSVFVNCAEQSRCAFADFYDKEVHDFETLYEKALPTVIHASADAVRLAVSTLAEHGLDITPEAFLDVAQNSIHLGSDLHEYTDLVERLTDFVEQLNSYRANKRSRSLRWQGGGFGIRGAVGGAIMAGALNLATDAVRGIGHVVVDSSDRARLKKVQIDLYKSKNHKANLSKILYQFCMDLFDPTIHLLEDNNLIDCPPFDVASVTSITEAFNLVNGREDLTRQDYEKALNQTLQGIPHQPYLLLSYLTLYKIPLVHNRDILNVVKFFGIEDEFAEKVSEYEIDALAQYESMPEKALEDINKKIAKAKELNIILCYTSIPLKTLEKKREDEIKRVEEENAKKAAELQQKRRDVEAFKKIAKLPEENLEQLQIKHCELARLLETPRIKKELDRVSAKLAQLTEQQRKKEEWASFLNSFADVGLDERRIAKKLINNSVFQSLYNELSRDIDQIKELMKRTYFRKKSYYHILLRDELISPQSSLHVIKNSFAPYMQNEIPIMYLCYPDINDRSGMLLSNQKIYIKGDSKNSIPYAIPLNEINSISISTTTSLIGAVFWRISVNETPAFKVYEDECLRRLTHERFIQILYFLINYCLFLASTEKNHTETFFLDVLNAANVSQDEFERNYHFSSKLDGNEQSTENIITPSAKGKTMFCTSCGKKISRSSKFCTFCGSVVTYQR